MFIEKEKFDALREAARNGDEKAAAILDSFRNDKGDATSLMEEYFAPAESNPEIEVQAGQEAKPEVEENRDGMSKLERYLADNEVKEGDDNYDEYVSEFYDMFPEEKKESTPEESATAESEGEEEEIEDPIQPLIDDEVEAIEEYQKYLNELLPSDMCPEKKAFITSKIEKIVNDEKQHIEILKEIQCHKDEGEQL